MTFRRAWLPSWPDYARLCGMSLRGRGSERRAVCGIHGGVRDSLTVNISGPWKCHACAAAGADVLAYHRAVHGRSFSHAARELGAWSDGDDRPPARPQPQPAVPDDVDTAERARKLRQAAEIWRASRQIIVGDIAAQYLVDSRCCTLPDPDGDLRWIPRLRLFGFDAPALVGRMTLAPDYRAFRGLHITFVAATGWGWRRLERRYLGPKSGCVVRLDADDAVTSGLAVGEGIETMLAVRHGYRPAWACMDAANLAAFPVLGGVDSLLVAADHDAAGIDAAQACAQRWADADREAGIVMDPSPTRDIADAAVAPC